MKFKFMNKSEIKLRFMKIMKAMIEKRERMKYINKKYITNDLNILNNFFLIK